VVEGVGVTGYLVSKSTHANSTSSTKNLRGKPLLTWQVLATKHTGHATVTAVVKKHGDHNQSHATYRTLGCIPWCRHMQAG
jgi:hypothetical protein